MEFLNEKWPPPVFCGGGYIPEHFNFCDDPSVTNLFRLK